MAEDAAHVGLEAKLAQLEELLAEAKPVPLSASVMLNRAEVDGLVGEIRAAVPEEVKQARWVVKERADVLAQARAEAETVVRAAQDERAHLVSETEVSRQARAEADRLLAERGRDNLRGRLGAEALADAVEDDDELD